MPSSKKLSFESIDSSSTRSDGKIFDLESSTTSIKSINYAFTLSSSFSNLTLTSLTSNLSKKQKPQPSFITSSSADDEKTTSVVQGNSFHFFKSSLCTKNKISVKKSIEKDKTVQLCKKRNNDYRDNKKNSLMIDSSTLVPTFKIKKEGDIFGRCSIYDLEKQKMNFYYVSTHNPIEYFALEVLSRIKINTPKGRIVQYIDKYSDLKFGMSVQEIADYIPMAIVRHDLPSLGITIPPLRLKYKLDIKKQLIIDLEDSSTYRISGNTFAADIAALLIDDLDFQPDSNNFGLTKIGNRFYSYAIDKELARFNGDDYSTLLETHTVYKNDLFSSRKQDQELAVLYEIAQSLESLDGQCDFERIFYNSSVEATSAFSKNLCGEWCKNLMSTATSMLKHYQKKYGKDYLAEFCAREKIRTSIADSVIKKLEAPKDIKEIIIEDLRGPYYIDCFISKSGITESDLTNKKLFDAIISDIGKEFNIKTNEDLSKQSKSTRSNKPS